MSNLDDCNKKMEAALHYAELGYEVFPCVPNEKRPATENGFKDASTDSDQIRQWWGENPDYNIGLYTQGLLVVDLDGKENSWPLDPDHKSDLSKASVSRTPNGKHYLFKEPEGKEWNSSTSKLAKKVDTRARGGYIVAPPSTINGTAYEWGESELTERPEELPEPPKWLVERLDQTCSSNDSHSKDGQWSTKDGSNPDQAVISEGQRNSTLARYAGKFRRDGLSQVEIAAAIHSMNKNRCRPPLNENEVDRIAESISQYAPDASAVASFEMAPEPEDPVHEHPDPGPLPEELFQVPGFIEEYMDYCLKTAHYPNKEMAFCGGISLLALLGGRKFTDDADSRTNIYLLGLAHSGSGKDHPRKINIKILSKVELTKCVGGQFASGEGIEDALKREQCMLFQTDEIDALLNSIKNTRDVKNEGIMKILLMLYTTSNSVFICRVKAGGDSSEPIDQPCLVLFGTAVPKCYYDSLSEKMLMNGFFARMIVVESSKRSDGQIPERLDLPSMLLEAADYWGNYQNLEGNLSNLNPKPQVIEYNDDAREYLKLFQAECDQKYRDHEKRKDEVGMAVWSRAVENTRKLALLYALSVAYISKEPVVTSEAVEWASNFIKHQTSD